VGFNNFRVVPPGTGICHQVNVEYLAQVVWTGEENGKTLAYPDTLVGTDSHTTMVNGLAVLGWGVGGIEAEAAMLGQPTPMLIPEVIGFKLTGKLKEGMTATDLVLTVTQMLRKKGVVNKFVEFYGPGLSDLSLTDRATIANMAPEYGATCGFFPIDKEVIRYLTFTGRDPQRVALVEAYAKAQGMWHDESTPEPEFTDTLALDLSTVEPSLAGPKRPQDRVSLSTASKDFDKVLKEGFNHATPTSSPITGLTGSVSFTMSGKLTVKGVQGHIAYPQLARNPIHQALPALTELAAIEWDRGNDYFQPTSWQISNIHAGTGATNVIPGQVVIDFNFRFSSESTAEALQQRLISVLEHHDLEYELQWTIGGHPFLTTPGSLVTAIQGAIRDEVGIETELSTTGGTSDGRFIAQICPQVIEFGPPNATIHKIDEHIAVADIEPVKNIYRRTLENLNASLVSGATA
jgi:hypothetical protein